MPRYFLHLRDGGETKRDEEGDQLSDVEAARAEALDSAREMWAEAIREGNGRDYLDAVFVITDQQGRELTTVSFLEALPPRLRSVGRIG